MKRSIIALIVTLASCGSEPTVSNLPFDANLADVGSADIPGSDSGSENTDARTEDVGGRPDVPADSVNQDSAIAEDALRTDVERSDIEPRDASVQDLPDAASAASGLPYSGEEEAGVLCDDEICTDGLACCRGVTSSGCYGSGTTSCGYLDFLCDGPEDCPGDTVCCVSGEIGFSLTGRSSCVAATECEGADTRAACNSDADCGTGSCIRGFTVLLMVDVGWCQDGPASDCEIAPGAECRGDDLTGAELSGLDGSGADFSRANFTSALMRYFAATDAVFDGADLTRTQLSTSLATGASFDDTTLDSTGFRGTDLTGATFVGAHGERSSFSECSLDGADFSGASLTRGSFNRGTAVGAQFDGADLTNATFSELDLTGASFEGALVEGVAWFGVTCPDGVFANRGETCEGHLTP